ncbi:SDR family NAD(P)-dependent oxidoreductase [Nocardia sp. 348MFTsu5.1]|uniref:SDR family NAD(P)-dependent oxidoreductase n=1 Tax=Nocardia sp. 348MFTsu5.1 TaxID=1172185 RepID=UPI0003A1C6BB|nr:SDR family NAD(P)-dependent oxidoreductase [Nocardia sp. 348MFTsu5.1]
MSKGRVVVLFGGRSEIGLEVAARIAAGATVILAARRSSELGDQRERLEAENAAAVHSVEFDANDTSAHEALIQQIIAEHGPIDDAIVAFGILGDQAKAEVDSTHALQIAHTDYLAQISVLTPLATAMRAAKRGKIIVFSSVAGVRVRRANYVYGSTKAGLDGFASGLSDALHGSGVHLLLVRSGFVIGNMTKDMMASGTKPAPMSSTAPEVADAVVKALHRGRRVVWVPGRLRPVFFVMRLLPQAIWRRMPR